MRVHLLRGRSLVFIVLKLLALALIAFSVASAPGLSSAPARSNPRDVGLAVGTVLVLFLASHWLLPARVDKVLTILALCAGLFIPGVFLAFRLATTGEQLSRQREVDGFLQRVTAPGHSRELAAYLLEPFWSPAPQLEGENLGRLEQRLRGASPEELRQDHLVECLLMGLEPVPSNQVLPLESLEPLSRLYVELKTRTGLSLDEAPFYLQQRDRVVSRIAEVGHARWQHEVAEEGPAFARVVQGTTFYPLLFEEVFPTPVAPGTRVVSSTLGSLPLHVLVLISQRIFPPPPGVARQTDIEAYTQRFLNEAREALVLMQSRGLDFTEEEKKLPGLSEFLARVRAATPPP